REDRPPLRPSLDRDSARSRLQAPQGRRMSRVPLRLRLTAAFAIGMAIVLAAAGFLLFHHLASSLDRTLDQGLRARAADVSALVSQADSGLRESQLKPGAANGFAQVLDARGRIFDQSPGVGRNPLLTQDQLARARRAPLLVGRTALGDENVRLLATPVGDPGHKLRTRLPNLQAEAELALESSREREDLVAALRSVGSETDRLSQLAADLLLLARLDDGTVPIRREEVDLDDLLEGVAARYGRRADEAGRTIRVESVGGRVSVDWLRVER